MTLKELLNFEFTINEDGEMIALVPLSRVNEIADILTNQKERIDKTIEILKDTNVEMPSSLLIETIDYARQILGDKE